ncbi:MAG: single-stranded-DNA-specific exonuclease RecJ [Oscillospiraceae bacterium]|nr:single-stranded-DNA-specific exonuclease RecJ [Oscillospiraceae bacterium]
MTYKNWNIHRFPRNAAVTLTRAGYRPLPAVVLASRGVSTAGEAERLLDRSLDLLEDPFLLKDMDRAVARIAKAAADGEKVMVFGDYDVDGMTSTCVMLEYLESLGLDVGFYIPGRSEDGYGLNMSAIRQFHEAGVRLIVTVDCGVTAAEEVRYASSLGMDVIVTDHHECKPELPEAVAVIDPKRPDCPYPNKHLAGVGVAFKTVCALAGPDGREDVVRRFLELVALGTVADVVPLPGENSVLVSHGLELLSRTSRPGLGVLLRDTCLDVKRVTTASVGFSLAPRLNAAGRMGRAELSVRLLHTADPEEAEAIAAELDALNRERRELVSAIYEEASAMAVGQDGPLVLARRGWFQGVMGIVAARISEQEQVPSVMICVDDDGMGRGSCRSFGSFSLYSALQSCSDLLEDFGGHEMAAGITIAESNIPAFARRFREYYFHEIQGIPEPALEIDYEVVKPGLLTLDDLEALTALEPFGNGNPPPVLCLRGAVLTHLSSVGNGAHSRFRISKNGESFDGIFFCQAPEDLPVKQGDRIDLAFEPQINVFRGRRSVQLMAVDVKPHSPEELL